VSPEELGVALEPLLETLSVEEPAKRKGGVILSSAAELVDRLKNEAKVL
jgi:electron transfer flavoprotein beta subunit